MAREHLGEAGNFARISDGQDGRDVEADRDVQFFDKDTFPLRPMTLDDGVRIVMGGSAIRDGIYVAPSVVVVPPAYINVGRLR